MPKRILIDSGFWMGYFERKDQYHNVAISIAQDIFSHTVLCPFPTLYEFLKTRVAKNIKYVLDYENLLAKLNIEYIYDDKYRFNILNEFILANKKSSQMSLVDLVINKMMTDTSIKIDCIATFNKKDFIKNCRNRNIEMIP